LLRASVYLGVFAPAFDLVREVEGVEGRNLRYIQELTGALVVLAREDRLLAVTADTDVVLAKALCLARIWSRQCKPCTSAGVLVGGAGVLREVGGFSASLWSWLFCSEGRG